MIISARKVLIGLVLIASALALISFIGQVAIHTLSIHQPLVVKLALFLSVDEEMNLPTWYSTMLLAAAGVLLGLIARAERAAGTRYARHWLGLSLIFFYLSMDELLTLHERVGIALRGRLHISPFFTWALVYGPLALVCALVYRRFVLDLPAPTRRRFILAGAMYVGAALGLDEIGGLIYKQVGLDHIAYFTEATIEEFLEMAGAAVFIYALLHYMRQQRLRFTLALSDDVSRLEQVAMRLAAPLQHCAEPMLRQVESRVGQVWEIIHPLAARQARHPDDMAAALARDGAVDAHSDGLEG